jgi:hypothetical protein
MLPARVKYPYCAWLFMRENLDADAALLSGSESGELLDTLHHMCSVQQDGDIKVAGEQGIGTIVVRAGQIAHASFQDLKGEEAFTRLAGCRSAKHMVVPRGQQDEQASINKPWEDLLIAAANRQSDPMPATGRDTPEGSADGLFRKIAAMSLAEKLRLALRCDKECRTILIRDASRVVQLAVISNQRISEGEVIAIAGIRSLDEEVLRRIANNRDWIKQYQVRLMLAKNPKTPASVSTRLLGTLLRQDLRLLARSKDVSMAVANAARRSLMHQAERKG